MEYKGEGTVERNGGPFDERKLQNRVPDKDSFRFDSTGGKSLTNDSLSVWDF